MMPFFSFDDDEFFGDLLMMGAAAGGGSVVQETATGNPLTFQTDLARPLKSLLIPFTPVQSGTGDPSPENIRPIVPWNGLKVWQSGKNILTGNFQNGVLALESGGTSYNPNYIVSDFIPVKPLKSYYFRCPTVVPSELDIVYYDKDKHYIGYADADGYSSCNTPGRSRKTPAGCYYVRIDARNAQYNNDICINYPASVTGYVPAVGVTETDISFPSPVYGGTLDVVSGVLTVEWAGVDLGSKSWTKRSENTSRQIWEARFNDCKFESYQTSAYKTNAICSQFALTTSNGTWSPGKFSPAMSQNNKVLIFSVPAESYASATECKEAMTGIIVAYELATPQEITLTPEQITALIGNNTIWSDADGSMTAVYLKKG